MDRSLLMALFKNTDNQPPRRMCRARAPTIRIEQKIACLIEIMMDGGQFGHFVVQHIFSMYREKKI